MAAHETRLRSSSSSGNEQRTTSLSISSEDLPPVWLTKSETDACYNECIQVLLNNVVSDIKVPKSQTKRLSESAWSFFTRKSIRDDTLSTTSDFQASPSPRLGILFGSHNWDSCKLILDSLLLKGLANVEGQTQDGEAIVRIGDEVTERVTMAQLYGTP